MAIALLCALGAIVGVLAGLLGIGGGAILVPALIYLLPKLGVGSSVLTQMAVGTSLGSICINSILSARAHHRRGGVLWRVVLSLAPGLVLGGLLGAWIAHFLSSLVLQRIVGVALLLIALRLITGGQPSGQRELPGVPALAGVGTFIGGLSSLIGIGGGAVTVPFLNWCNVAMARAVGTSAACGIAIAWSGVLGFALAGWGSAETGVASLGYISLPAVAAITVCSLVTIQFGAALAYRLPARALKRIFAVLLVAVGINMLVG